MTGRPWRDLAISLLLSAVFLTIFVGRADMRAVFGEIVAVRPGYLFASMAAFLAATGYRGVRWAHLMSTERTVSRRDGVECTLMGWSVTMLLPGRLGDLARPLLIARRERVRRSLALGAIALERVLDLLVVLAMLALYLAIWFEPTGASERMRIVVAGLRVGGWTVLFGLLLAFALITALRSRFQAPRAHAARLLALLPERWRARAGSSGGAFLEGLAGPRGGRALAAAAGQTLVLWLLICSSHGFLFRAFGMQLPLYSVFPLLVMIIIGSLVPTPAAVGTYHAAVQFVLTELLDQPLDVASGYALTSHALAYLPAGVLGGWLLAKEGSSAIVMAMLSARDSRGDRDIG